jgi:hypothetical protein
VLSEDKGVIPDISRVLSGLSVNYLADQELSLVPPGHQVVILALREGLIMTTMRMLLSGFEGTFWAITELSFEPGCVVLSVSLATRDLYVV